MRGVVESPPDGGDAVDTREGDNGRGHYVVCLELTKDWIRLPLKKRNLLKLNMNVVDTRVEPIANPLRTHESDHQRETIGYIVRCLQQNNSKRDSHASFTSEDRSSSNESESTGIDGKLREPASDQVTNQSTNGSTSNERRHEKTRRNCDTESPARQREVGEGKEGQSRFGKLSFIVEQLLDCLLLTRKKDGSHVIVVTTRAEELERVSFASRGFGLIGRKSRARVEVVGENEGQGGSKEGDQESFGKTDGEGLEMSLAEDGEAFVQKVEETSNETTEAT